MMVAAIAASAQARLPTQVQDLDWLSGRWQQERREEPGVVAWTVETWAAPKGGVMLGTSLSGRRVENSPSRLTSDRAQSFEFMRIAAGPESTLHFYASPNGATAVAFRLVEASAAHAVFQNPDNDYPQRIVYRRTGNRLDATISLLDGTRAVSWAYRRR
jgi:hypothetical protein